MENDKYEMQRFSKIKYNKIKMGTSFYIKIHIIIKVLLKYFEKNKHKIQFKTFN